MITRSVFYLFIFLPPGDNEDEDERLPGYICLSVKAEIWKLHFAERNTS